MQRCTASAAGGTIQRLNPGAAIVASFEKNDVRVPAMSPVLAVGLLSDISPPLFFIVLLMRSHRLPHFLILISFSARSFHCRRGRFPRPLPCYNTFILLQVFRKPRPSGPSAHPAACGFSRH